MDILFVASELAPTVKVGGLADVVFALSKTLKALGHKVTVALPRYPAFERAGILVARRLTPLTFHGPTQPGLPKEAIVFEGRLATGVELVLFDAVDDDKRSVFADVESDALVYEKKTPDGVDPAVRFALFSRAVVEYVRQRVQQEQPFEVVHLHDWPAAMVAYLLRQHPELAALKSVLTIHNLAHQGNVTGPLAKRTLAALGLDEAHFTPQSLEFYGGVNLLKGGIVAADAVTTVSATYAAEILTEAGGERLDGVLRARPKPVVGIPNGVDYAVWNPAIDPHLVARYDSDDPSNKARCRSTLLAELGLPLDPQVPLVVVLGRVALQKGSDVLAKALPRLLRQEATFVIAGSGDAKIEAELHAGVAHAPERAKYLGHVSEAMSHRLLAAADFVLLPSRFEPAGLVQVHAQRYGAVPIVTRTGGFIDTVVDVDVDLETGTGVVLEAPPSEAALIGAVGRALSAFSHPRFTSLKRRVMRLDLGWERPARRYAQLYTKLSTPETVATKPAPVEAKP